MRELLSMLLALAAIAASGADLRPCWRNLITNFDHRERMGVDLPMGWAKHIKDKVTTKIEGATELPNLRYETVSAVRTKVGMRLLRYVFRADSDKARLVFTDRKDDGSAAPDGFRQVLNYVSFMPYYVESPEEPAEIAAALGWKGANRIRNGK